MAKLSTAIVSLALLFNGVSALVPSNVPKTKRPAFDAKRAATNSMAAASIASALVIGPMADAVDMAMDTPSFGSSSLVAERVTREGLYREYDVEVPDQVYDDARSTYKSAKETKTKKGKNLAGALTYLHHLYLYTLFSDLINVCFSFFHSNNIYLQENTLLLLPFLWLVPSSFPWRNISGMSGMMIHLISSS
jgi:hypothetical protein